jgi:drug/metabolite transporter (DMT)-like permease
VRAYDWARFAALAVIWSLQYIFLRLAVPVFGTGPVADARAVFGTLILVPAALLMGQRIAARERWREYLIIAVPNYMLPFLCFAWAATVLPAGYLAIINGTVPLWAALFAVWALKEPMSPGRIAGFVLGIAGVALIVRLGPVQFDASSLLGALISLTGAALWGWGGVVIKRHSGSMPPVSMAAGSLAFAALAMSPLLALVPPPAQWTLDASAAVVTLGVLSSGIAYLAFFTLVRDIGPARALATGLTVPVLGVLWGWLFLDESVTLAMLVGIALVVGALVLVLRR